MAALKTTYKDDILSSGTKRKYNQTTNTDGTVSFEDVSEYTQEGDTFGAADINATNTLVNSSLQIVSFDTSTGELVTKSVS